MPAISRPACSATSRKSRTGADRRLSEKQDGDRQAGHPVVVSLRNADWPALAQDYTLDPIVTRFELKDADGNLVPSVILSSVAQGGPGVTLHQDPQLPYDGFVVLVPSAPLAAGKTYTAAFEATLKSGATPLVRSVSFTTAP